MHITRHTEGANVERTGEALFQGQVNARTLAGAPATTDFTASIVSFAPGARTRMHQHSGDQLLYVVHGVGQVGTPGETHVVGSGDMVVIPAHEDHWHGAGDTGAPMGHLTIMRGDSKTTITD